MVNGATVVGGLFFWWEHQTSVHLLLGESQTYCEGGESHGDTQRRASNEFAPEFPFFGDRVRRNLTYIRGTPSLRTGRGMATSAEGAVRGGLF